MISIDTQLMRDLVSGCTSANDAIEEAVSALAAIPSHDDWGCREKVRINEYTIINKSKIQELKQNADSFLKVLKQVTHDFEEAEKDEIFCPAKSGFAQCSSCGMCNGRTANIVTVVHGRGRRYFKRLFSEGKESESL